MAWMVWCQLSMTWDCPGPGVSGSMRQPSIERFVNDMDWEYLNTFLVIVKNWENFKWEIRFCVKDLSEMKIIGISIQPI